MKTDLQITIDNLKIVLDKLPKLAEQLPEIKAEFDMNFYGCYTYASKTNKVCETYGCLLGNMPRVFKLTVECYNNKGFFSYPKFSAFYFPTLCVNAQEYKSYWYFLFSSDWADFQSTFEQAMERVKYFIDCEGEIGEWEFQKESFIKLHKYEVILMLMVDPTKSEKTFNKSYIVEAKNESAAYTEATKLQDVDEEDIRYRSVFNYKVYIINNKKTDNN